MRQINFIEPGSTVKLNDHACENFPDMKGKHFRVIHKGVSLIKVQRGYKEYTFHHMVLVTLPDMSDLEKWYVDRFFDGDREAAAFDQLTEEDKADLKNTLAYQIDQLKEAIYNLFRPLLDFLEKLLTRRK